MKKLVIIVALFALAAKMLPNLLKQIVKSLIKAFYWFNLKIKMQSAPLQSTQKQM